MLYSLLNLKPMMMIIRDFFCAIFSLEESYTLLEVYENLSKEKKECFYFLSIKQIYALSRFSVPADTIFIEIEINRGCIISYSRFSEDEMSTIIWYENAKEWVRK